MIPLFKVSMSEKVREPMNEVLYSGYIGQGPKVIEFENALSVKFNNPYGFTTSAGTHALHLALRLCGVGPGSGVGPGDEVITTPLTCTATSFPILMQGANIVWADVRDDFNIDPADVEKKITKKTKAIICVHWGGYPCDMDVLYEIAKNNNIRLIEDAAHTYGSRYRGSIIGDCRYSSFAMMSFQAIKHLTTIDGGVLFCRNQYDYERGKLLRWYGINRESLRRDMRCEEEIIEFGYKYHLSDVCATVGLYNMNLADENVKKCQDNAKFYNRELSKCGDIKLTQNRTDRRSSYWLYSFLVEDRHNFSRVMTRKGIHCSKVHERNDIHACVEQFKTELPGLDSINDKLISIPVGAWVTKEDREYIVECINEGW